MACRQPRAALPDASRHDYVRTRHVRNYRRACRGDAGSRSAVGLGALGRWPAIPDGAPDEAGRAAALHRAPQLAVVAVRTGWQVEVMQGGSIGKGSKAGLESKTRPTL